MFSLEVWELSVMVILAAVFIYLVVVIFSQKKKIKTLERLVAVDPLTGLFNRRSFDLEWNMLIGLLPINDDRRTHGVLSEISVLFIDVDWFKKINDTYGHDYGDLVLRKVAAVIKGAVRDCDLVCRWGGEEIVVVMLGVTKEESLKKAEQIRFNISQLIFDHEGLSVTASIGVANAGSVTEAESVTRRADSAMYDAKRDGRDRVCDYRPI